MKMMRHLHKSQDRFRYGAVFYMVFLLAHIIILMGGDGVYVNPDSLEYYADSRSPLTDSRFWGGRRTPTALAFYKLFPDAEMEDMSIVEMEKSHYVNDDIVLLYGQTMASLVAFSFLAFACAKTAQSKNGRLFLFMFPLLLSFIPSLLRWNFMALSESLAITFLVVFVAVWVRFTHTKRLYWLVGVALVALFWAGVRDINAHVLIMIALVIMAVLVRPCCLKKLPMMMLCNWFICIFALSNFSANTGNRWVLPFYNNISQRILPVSERVSYFSDHGMPVTPELLLLSGKWPNHDRAIFYNNPALEKFSAWSLEYGKMTYIKFLVTHPIYSISAPIFQVTNDFLGLADRFQIYPVKHVYHNHDPRIRKRTWIGLIYFLIAYSLTVYYAFVWWRRKSLYRYPYLAVLLVMVLLAAPNAWLSWHGDAAETARHTLLAFIQFQLGIVLLLIYVWDHGTGLSNGYLLRAWRTESARASPGERSDGRMNRRIPKSKRIRDDAHMALRARLGACYWRESERAFADGRMNRTPGFRTPAANSSSMTTTPTTARPLSRRPRAR